MRALLLGVFVALVTQHVGASFNVASPTSTRKSPSRFSSPTTLTVRLTPTKPKQIGAKAGTAKAASPSGPPPAVLKARAAENNAYDQTKFRSFNMAMTPANVALMNKDPKQELKVHCNVTSDYLTPQAQTLSSPNVGCGYKGSVGSLRICFDHNGAFQPDMCRKPSLKIDTTYFGKKTKDKILGLKRMMFHGAPADRSLMAERLSYNMLGQWGIAAPEATHASLYQNAQSLGVFVFVEAIDDVFTKQHFGDDYNHGKGALYKEAWFNPLHMQNLSATLKCGKREDAFMYEIESAMLSTPLNAAAAEAFLEKYFDTDSIIKVTAADTVLGNTDDWRERHNLFWYIREDAQGKKAVLIPWDYDRIDDQGADVRGALKGRPWWDPTTAIGCNDRIRSPAERGAITGGGDPVQDAYWADLYANYPPDVEVPVSCDHITQLMAVGLGPRIRQKTRELVAGLDRQAMEKSIATWTAQIQAALARDPDGPQYHDMLNEQKRLLDWIFKSAQKAITDANAGDVGPTFGSSGKQTAGDFYKYKTGQVITSTFTPVGGATSTTVNYNSNGAIIPNVASPATNQPFQTFQQAFAQGGLLPSFQHSAFFQSPSFPAPSFASPSLSATPSFATSFPPSFVMPGG